MLIHFLNEYSIEGRLGNKLRIKGSFPGIKQNDYIFLNESEGFEEEKTYRIEEIQYSQDANAFLAVISVGELAEYVLKA